MGINKMNNLERLQQATRDHLQGRVLKNSLERLGSSVVNEEKRHAELLEEQRQHPPNSLVSTHPNITQFPTGYHNPRATDPFWQANARSRSQNRVRAAKQEERNQINMKEQEGSLPDGFGASLNNAIRRRKHQTFRIALQSGLNKQTQNQQNAFNSFRQRKRESNQQQQLGRVFNQKLSRKEKNNKIRHLRQWDESASLNAAQRRRKQRDLELTFGRALQSGLNKQKQNQQNALHSLRKGKREFNQQQQLGRVLESKQQRNSGDSQQNAFTSFRQRKRESNQQSKLGRVFNQKLSRKEKNNKIRHLRQWDESASLNAAQRRRKQGDLEL